MLSGTGAIAGMFALLSLLPYLVSTTESWEIQQGISSLTGCPPCDTLISAGLGDRLLLPSSPAYEPRVQSWFAANPRYRPWCFFQPDSAQEVSVAIQALRRVSSAGDWSIAVRSGGHGPPGSNNIANGVTIDLGLMNGSKNIPGRGFASVEPGGKWKDVYYNLLQHGNATVTGGRDGDVGVGGFLLGGGNSYYNGRNGYGCDEVVGYQAVLANGTIAEANVKENPDLWKALKGGGFNFGIVTCFDLQTMPAVDLAYGRQMLSFDCSDDAAEALVQFTDDCKDRPEDSLITFYNYDTTTVLGGDDFILLIHTNTLSDLNTTGFDTLNKIPSIVPGSLQLMSLADAANASQVEPGQLFIASTLTFLNDVTTVRQTHAIQAKHVASFSQKIGASSFALHVVYQPLPTHFPEIGKRNGGNMLGLDHVPSDAIMWTAAVGLKESLKEDREAALAVAQAELAALTAEIRQMTKEKGTDVDLVYLNYADLNQNPLGSYGADNVAFIKKVAKQYDPEGFWQHRAPGGFKISRVEG